MMVSADALQAQFGKLKKASWREPSFMRKEEAKEAARKVMASINFTPKSYTDFTMEELEKYEKSDLEKLRKNLLSEKRRLSAVNSTIANGRNFFERIYKIAAENAYDKNTIITKIKEITRIDKNPNTANYCDTILKSLMKKELPEDIKSYFESAIDKSNKGIASGREDIHNIDEKLKLVEQRIKYLIDLEEKAKQVASTLQLKMPELVVDKSIHINEIKKAVVFMASVAASFMVLGTASAATLSLTLAATACAKHFTHQNYHDRMDKLTDLSNKYILFGISGLSVGIVEDFIYYGVQSLGCKSDAQDNKISYFINTALASGCCVALGAVQGIVTFSFIKGVELMQEQVNYWSDFKCNREGAQLSKGFTNK
jgi:hypothetical protein